MGKGSKTKTEQTNTLDPEIKAKLFATTDSTNAYADDVLAGNKSLAAPTTEAFNSFIGNAQKPGTTGADFKDIATKFGAQPTLKFNATGPAVATIGDYGKADYGKATYADTPSFGTTPTVTAQKGYTNMDPYMSKYTGSVIDAAIGDLGAQRDKSQVQSNLAASAAGAAGGSRQGIRDSEVTNDYLRNVASTSANLRNQGFNTAAQLGMQDSGMGLQADTTNAGNEMARLGAEFAANNNRNASMFAADNARNASIFSADNARNASLFDAGNTASEANAARAQNTGQFNAQGDFNAQGANADLYNKGLLGQQGAIQAGSDVDMRNLAMQGTAAGMAQDQANINSPLEALKLKLASTGMLPTITNSSQSTTQKPGLFDWLSLGAKAAGCWVAREVYGEQNPAWLVFREWLSTKAPKWLFYIYNKFGERFAAFIRNKPRIKAVIRALMNIVVEK